MEPEGGFALLTDCYIVASTYEKKKKKKYAIGRERETRFYGTPAICFPV